MYLEISQNSQENTIARVFFFQSCRPRPSFLQNTSRRLLLFIKKLSKWLEETYSTYKTGLCCFTKIKLFRNIWVFNTWTRLSQTFDSNFGRRLIMLSWWRNFKMKTSWWLAWFCIKALFCGHTLLLLLFIYLTLTKS